jgi:hypothetical protein
VKKLLATLKGLEDAIGPDWARFDGFVGIRVLFESAPTVIFDSAKSLAAFQAEAVQTEAIHAVLESFNVSYAIEPKPSAKSMDAGIAGKGDGLVGHGTLGWYIVLDGVPVAVSNWHVLCPLQDKTQAGHPSLFLENGAFVRFGTLHDFDPVDTANPRIFDFALSRIDDPSMISGLMTSCEDGHRHPYPMRLGLSGDLNATDLYRTVGARPPTCSTAPFLGVASITVSYDTFGRDVHFQQQLVFKEITSSGDSGSVIVNARNNRVVGLIFAGGNQYDYANPLFRKGWAAIGTRRVAGVDLPAFETEDRQVRLLDLPDLNSPPLPPFFKAGQKISGCTTLMHLMDLGHIDGNGIRLDQPLGEWVQITFTLNHLAGNASRKGVWMHAASGVIYW